VFRQYKENLFYLFLVLAFFDPIGVMFWLFFSINTAPLLPLLVSLSLVLTLQNKNSLLKYKWAVITSFISLVLITILIGNKSLFYMQIVGLHIYIVYKIFILFTKNSIYEKGINVFYILLLFYELMNLFKVFNYFFAFNNFFKYSTITSIFQITIGIYFSIVKESSPKNFFRFKTL